MKTWLISLACILFLAADLFFVSHSPKLEGIGHIGPAYLYPDSSKTPGLIATQDFTDLTKSWSGQTYSQFHRQTSDKQKAQVCLEYSAGCKVPHEIDHFCPLALGCADDVKNLWAQPLDNEWNGQNWGYKVKDRLEAYMVLQMKEKKISPKDAQDCILNDWVACYQKYLGTQSFGGAEMQDPDS